MCDECGLPFGVSGRYCDGCWEANPSSRPARAKPDVEKAALRRFGEHLQSTHKPNTKAWHIYAVNIVQSRCKLTVQSLE